MICDKKQQSASRASLKKEEVVAAYVYQPLESLERKENDESLAQRAVVQHSVDRLGENRNKANCFTWLSLLHELLG